jgi:ABC-type phosphate transport system permease subunit
MIKIGLGKVAGETATVLLVAAFVLLNPRPTRPALGADRRWFALSPEREPCR